MGNICCSQKEDASWLTEQVESDLSPNRQPISYMIKLDLSQIDHEGEAEDLTHRIVSKRDELDNHVSESSSDWSADLSQLEEEEAGEKSNESQEFRPSVIKVDNSSSQLELQVIRCETDQTDDDVRAAMTVLEP